MFAKRIDRKKRMNAMVDMDDFLVTYGAEKLGAEKKNLSQIIYNAGKNNLKGLDDLFKDKGFGRIHKFEEIGEGFISDRYGVNGQQLQQDTKSLARAALTYLGAHANQFNHWKQA